jgi:hypothetical protein
MAPKDETGAERKARYERIGTASAKTIKTMLAGTALGDKLRAKGYTWVPEKNDSSKKGADRSGQLPCVSRSPCCRRGTDCLRRGVPSGAHVLDNFSRYPQIVHVWFIYIACSRQVPTRRLN